MVGNPIFSEITASLRAEGVLAYDATWIFDGLETSPYLDFAHVAHAGHGRIAAFLFELVLREGLVHTPVNG